MTQADPWERRSLEQRAALIRELAASTGHSTSVSDLLRFGRELLEYEELRGRDQVKSISQQGFALSQDEIGQCLETWFQHRNPLHTRKQDQNTVPLVLMAFRLCRKFCYKPVGLVEPLIRKAVQAAQMKIDTAALEDILAGAAQIRLADENMENTLLGKYVSTPFEQRNMPRAIWAATIISRGNSNRWLTTLWKHLDQCRPQARLRRTQVAGLRLHHARLYNSWQRPLAAHWESLIAEALAHAKTFKPHAGQFETSVKQALRRLGHTPNSQVVVEGYHLDFVLEEEAGKLAVECDGARFHCLNWDPERGPTGRDIMRDAILQSLSYRVVHVYDTVWWNATDRLGLLRKLVSQ